jgi:hypothetical protein
VLHRAHAVPYDRTHLSSGRNLISSFLIRCRQRDSRASHRCFGGGCKNCGVGPHAAAGVSAVSDRPPRSIHQLRGDMSHSIYTYSVHNEISARISSGDIVELQCWDSSEHDLPDSAAATVDKLLNRTRPLPLGGWGSPGPGAVILHFCCTALSSSDIYMTCPH